MFSYYGSKSKVIDLYPAPRYGKIIEPFAGSARYALKYWDRDVLLVDKYEVIVRIWKWLQAASEVEISGLPDIASGQSVDEFDIPIEAKWLMGFCINRGSAQPKTTAKDFNSWNSDKTNISANLSKIRHWKIQLGDYRDIPNQEATWFIDPPYQCGGEYYRLGNKYIDYGSLRRWSESRNGQIIVCENTKAKWMPFSPIGELGGSLHTTTEAIWCNDVQQMALVM